MSTFRLSPELLAKLDDGGFARRTEDLILRAAVDELRGHMDRFFPIRRDDGDQEDPTPVLETELRIERRHIAGAALDAEARDRLRRAIDRVWTDHITRMIQRHPQPYFERFQPDPE